MILTHGFQLLIDCLTWSAMSKYHNYHNIIEMNGQPERYDCATFYKGEIKPNGLGHSMMLDLVTIVIHGLGEMALCNMKAKMLLTGWLCRNLPNEKLPRIPENEIRYHYM